ncbi:DnaJ-domain-containing protein [Tuber magnatum]|uniref:DnaJ-domain-containing protein n=1 Tax=Tuber magnatum TaxID=42249 RepID=A0A317SV45_9PEZI|nr:DnaJ-domain-containing protein [Tuber magnatum]
MSDSESSSGSGTPPPITKSPYEILGVPTTSTTAEIRSAYRKLALTVHPDKVPEGERDTAKIAFQELTFAYGVLSDEARRKRFDETGSTSETAEGGFDWKAFYKAQMADLITTESLRKFKEEYQGSEEEKQAVIAAYRASEGSMDKIFESVMCSDVLEDEERFREIINEALDTGQIKSFRNFTHENKASKKRRRAKAEAERREAEACAKELGIHDELFNKKAKSEDVENGHDEEGAADKGSKGSRRKKTKKADAMEDDISGLRNLIQKRSNNRMEEMMSNLEAKYLPKPKTKKKVTANSKRKKAADPDDEDEEEAGVVPPEPTEEQFLAARSRMEGSKKAKSTKEARGKTKAVKEDGADTELRRSKRVKR